MQNVIAAGDGAFLLSAVLRQALNCGGRVLGYQNTW